MIQRSMAMDLDLDLETTKLWKLYLIIIDKKSGLMNKVSLEGVVALLGLFRQICANKKQKISWQWSTE